MQDLERRLWSSMSAIPSCCCNFQNLAIIRRLHYHLLRVNPMFGHRIVLKWILLRRKSFGKRMFGMFETFLDLVVQVLHIAQLRGRTCEGADRVRRMGSQLPGRSGASGLFPPDLQYRFASSQNLLHHRHPEDSDLKWRSVFLQRGLFHRIYPSWWRWVPPVQGHRCRWECLQSTEHWREQLTPRSNRWSLCSESNGQSLASKHNFPRSFAGRQALLSSNCKIR